MPGIDLTTPPVAPGLYGKLPILGDFVSRRLPAEFIRPWDDWIQAALSASRAQLGAHWLEIYLTSPIWRFVLGPGNCGKAALAGVLMPSVDKVGRYFPLTLAAVIDDPRQAPAGLMIMAASWFDDLEQLALSALTDDIRLDEFDLELQGRRLSPALTVIPDADRGVETQNGRLIFQTGMERLEQLADAFTQMSARLLPRSWPAFTLWSTNGSERLGPSLRVYDGLPPAEEFACFLTGEWPSRGDQPPIAACASLPAEDTDAGTAIKWRSSARTTTGKVRELNEDAFLEKPESGLWAVADGMGGHLAGDEAARAVVDALGSVSPENTIGLFSASVTARLENTNTELLRRARKNDPHQIMGSTVVVMLAVGRHCVTLWAGDSRLYRWRGGLLSQLTRDHSMISEIEPQDAPSPDMPVGNALSNIVTRALGAEPELALDTLSFEARPGDIYLLCSDGLVKEVRPREITDIISGPDGNASSQELIDLALARGARDNVTVVVIAAEGDTEVAS
jgi:type VI secretion system protein ImpM